MPEGVARPPNTRDPLRECRRASGRLRGRSGSGRSRRSGRLARALARMGRQAGQFMVPHNIAEDSQGNLYITEVDTGQRVQRFRRVEQQAR